MSDFQHITAPTARKEHQCEYCYGPIRKGEPYLRWSGRYLNEWQCFPMHPACAASFWDSDDEEFEPGGNPAGEFHELHSSTIESLLRHAEKNEALRRTLEAELTLALLREGEDSRSAP